jgi:hypothetical protein
MVEVPKPKNFASIDLESFEDYRARLSAEFDVVPDSVIETWIYRHWPEFQEWLPLRPLEWKYTLVSMSSSEVMRISHVSDWPAILQYWGDDLLDGTFRKNTWLGRYMLEYGTTPAPMIVAINAGGWGHPREGRRTMREPYQIVEGHMRLAYLQALIRRSHVTLAATHKVFLAELPSNNSLQAGRGL